MKTLDKFVYAFAYLQMVLIAAMIIAFIAAGINYNFTI